MNNEPKHFFNRDQSLQNNLDNRENQIKNNKVQAGISLSKINDSSQESISLSSLRNNNSTFNNNYVNSNNEELLKIFIGKNYEKITTRKFNFAGFFFSTFYLLYRKMFLYSVLVFLIDFLIINFINGFIAIAVNILVGLFVNKIYVSSAKKKVEKIKVKNFQKSSEEIKDMCLKKGGTSVGQIFGGMLVEIAISILIVFLMLLNGIKGVILDLIDFKSLNIPFITNLINDKNKSNGNNKGVLLENITISDYVCVESMCSYTFEDSEGKLIDCDVSDDISQKLDLFDKYGEYIKLNIYINNNKMTKYEVFLKSNNEDITNILDENELRRKIGLYSLGAHTERLTLTNIGSHGFGMEDDKSFSYITYTFVNKDNHEFEMKYILRSGLKEPDLIVGNSYNVTFEVKEGIFEYDYNIKSIN